MNIEIQARDFSLSEALDDYINRRIHFVVSSRFEQIRRIRVRLSDINGPRGGIDKRCQIQISLPQLHDIVIEDTEADLYIAIDRATDRAGRTLDRKLKRQHGKNRRAFVPHKRTPEVFMNDQYL